MLYSTSELGKFRELNSSRFHHRGETPCQHINFNISNYTKETNSLRLCPPSPQHPERRLKLMNTSHSHQTNFFPCIALRKENLEAGISKMHKTDTRVISSHRLKSRTDACRDLADVDLELTVGQTICTKDLASVRRQVEFFGDERMRLLSVHAK